MKILGKTKIIRLPGCEVYFQKVQFKDGDIRWRRMEKDLSAILQRDRATAFKGASAVTIAPGTLQTHIPIPANFADDLLSPFARLEYAPGHQPPPAFRL